MFCILYLRPGPKTEHFRLTHTLPASWWVWSPFSFLLFLPVAHACSALSYACLSARYYTPPSPHCPLPTNFYYVWLLFIYLWFLRVWNFRTIKFCILLRRAATIKVLCLPDGSLPPWFFPLLRWYRLSHIHISKSCAPLNASLFLCDLLCFPAKRSVPIMECDLGIGWRIDPRLGRILLSFNI